MKKIKLKITINGKMSSTTINSEFKENEILDDIVKKGIKDTHFIPQKYVITVNGVLDDGMIPLSNYNEKPLKARIVVILKECF